MTRNGHDKDQILSGVSAMVRHDIVIGQVWTVIGRQLDSNNYRTYNGDYYLVIVDFGKKNDLRIGFYLVVL